VIEAARGIAQIADTSMSLAVRGVSVERGYDPRDCAMIAFGGAGPLHAVSIAREIFVPRVIVPRYPGNFSALGMLLAPWRDDLVQTFVADLADVDGTAVDEACDSLRNAARTRLADEGVTPERATFRFSADLRYRGQEHTIPVPFAAPDDLLRGGSPALRAAFDELHDRRYGHAAPDETIQVVNLRLTVLVTHDDGVTQDWLSAPFEPEDAQPDQQRDVIFDDPAKPIPARIVWRPGLGPGSVVEGPAVIEEPNSTTLLYPGDRATVTAHGHLDIILAKTGTQGDDQ
jgi:N-methylhydantoinase A